jgi:hypothetical protein
MPTTPPDTPRRPIAPGRRDVAALLALAAALAPPRGTASAQSAWPDRPVRLVVPFGPGGAIDTLSRAVAQPFPQLANGQALVVETAAARAAPSPAASWRRRARTATR